MKLIVAPHVDDDVIGCGGILDSDCYVLYLGVDDFHIVDAAQRREEAIRVSELSGSTFWWPTNNTTLRVNKYADGFTMLVEHLEANFAVPTVDEVYLPWPSYNQDHRAVYDAAMIALRPHDKNRLVKRVFLYEEPDCFWPGMREPFKPNYFVPIDLRKKLELVNEMRSQLRGHRSLDMIAALAGVRGAAVMQPAAEAFHILRWVE